MTANTRPDPPIPHDLRAERAVLGAVLLNPVVAAQLLPLLKPGHFYRPWHGQLLEAAQALHRAGSPVDPITVHDELRRRGLRGEPGRSCGVLIHDLLEAVPVTSSGSHYARIVLEQSARRRLVQAGVKLVQLAQQPPDGPGDLDELMRDVVQELACVRAAVDTYHRSDPHRLPPAEPEAATRSLRAVGPDR
jgi:replicative DNA helicase